ncbi:hypothetical protein M1P56_03670 [Streptomyces sp. HU2014]|uniref:Uncharacterized protein n=1 Tax=Streptomyces albireticuli TaxID=1940 RepID=A0A1Z2L6L6_9ACTN|nr:MULTISPECIES: hypothetical protein [Streptomyces]ARZ69946.1 hypothetical protein SMD11_4340 [Streptomyces albireticuli]UQI43536.1 hypothetical protein M1P56_03670 [Streptomyces sp. HU2014]
MADRTSVRVPCPGNGANFVRLTNEVTTPGGVGHPANTGDCELYLHGVDRNGFPIHQGLVSLDPGQAMSWYHAPPGAVAIAAQCSVECDMRGELTYDTPNT